MDIYVVQPNDTINSIAEKYNVSASKLIRDNGITKPNELVPGQTIVIVYPTQTYTVKEGDTLMNIANVYQVSPMQLLRNNPTLTKINLIPGEEITISYNTTRKIRTNGFVYPYINKETLKKTLPNLTYITIYNYRSISKGETISYYDDTDIIRISREYGTIPLMLLTSLSAQGEPDVEAAYSILLNNDYQENVITTAISIMKTKGYAGANILFNYMNPSNLSIYENFIKNLSTRFEREGLFLFLTINPSISQLSFEKIDYSTMSEYLMNISFLQFIWGTNYGPPHPVNSINLITNLINNAITTMPPEKITVGNSLISYDWNLPYIPGVSFANSLSINTALNLAYDMGTTIEFDEISQSPFFTYNITNDIQNVEHIVWSIDARSILALVELIINLKLNGATFWNLMVYYPQLWLVINTHFEVEKLLDNTLFK